MTKERLSHFIYEAQALESGREGVPEIVNVQILNLGEVHILSHTA